MELNKLYELSEKENISIYNYHIQDCYGMYLNYDKINAIALNYKDLETNIKEKCILAEELGHYYASATYSLNADSNFIRKQETKAKRWSYNILIPLQELKLAIKNGKTTLYTLSDFFDVTIDFMRSTIEFYRLKGLLKTNSC